MTEKSLEERVVELEAAVAAIRRPRKHWTDILSAFGPYFGGTIVAVLGFIFTGAVTNAINRSKLQLDQVSEMRDLLLKIGNSAASPSEVRATVFALAAFGQPAVAPLLSLLEGAGDTTVVNVRDALRLASLSGSDAVCNELGKVIENRTRLFSWETHLWIIEMIGDIGCQDLRPFLLTYVEMVDESLKHEQLLPLTNYLKPSPQLTKDGLQRMKSAAETSVGLMVPTNQE